nr:uncharacterized protein LOC114288479 [Ipomoea batatas]
MSHGQMMLLQLIWQHQTLHLLQREEKQALPMFWLSVDWMKMLMKKCFAMNFLNMLLSRIFDLSGTSLPMFQGDLHLCTSIRLRTLLKLLKQLMEQL